MIQPRPAMFALAAAVIATEPVTSHSSMSIFSALSWEMTCLPFSPLTLATRSTQALFRTPDNLTDPEKAELDSQVKAKFPTDESLIMAREKASSEIEKIDMQIKLLHDNEGIKKALYQLRLVWLEAAKRGQILIDESKTQGVN